MPEKQETTLFSPFTVRGVTMPNRIVVSPMGTFAATDGYANDWHFVHLGRFALGGAGCVFVEVTAVQRHGRVSHGCVGLWEDAQAEPLKRIAEFLTANGSVAGIQLGHAGRKASRERPWFGYRPLGVEPDQGEEKWKAVGPTETPVGAGWPSPAKLTVSEIEEIVESFGLAAARADQAGFDILEVHAAHGYLVHAFLSPLSNTRDDQYGSDRQGRMRFAIEIADAIRANWPSTKPLSFRLSAVDGFEGGWEIADSLALAGELKQHGVDLIDCSSGGIQVASSDNMTPTSMVISQVRFAAQMSRPLAEMGLRTIAVGQITEPEQAETILNKGYADLIAIGREMLMTPNWSLIAARDLGVDPNYELWPIQIGSWLARRKLLDMSERS